jgi:orotate phosphoribosyltransferase-like protein
MKRAPHVHESELLTEHEVADRLRLSANRVRWLIVNGHLQRGVTPDGRAGGVTEASVEREQAWRSSATSSQRLRRVLSYAFTWLP